MKLSSGASQRPITPTRPTSALAMLKLKGSHVSLKDLAPQMCFAIMVVQSALAEYQKDAVITSGNDSHHMDGSLHYRGLALDFRTSHLSEGQITIISAKIKDALPGYDVVLESDHLHIEYDPK
jgi:hypothetical protein